MMMRQLDGIKRAIGVSVAVALATHLWAATLPAQTASQTASVQLKASVSETPLAITLEWVPHPSTTGFVVYRRNVDSGDWGDPVATLDGAATHYVDEEVTLGQRYEYRVVRSAAAGEGTGYLWSGIDVPMVDDRGRILLLVDMTVAQPLAAEIAVLTDDLTADGWTVLREDVDPDATPASVRALIASVYNDNPTRTAAVYLLGHIPVPYSGFLSPDGHATHRGAWPADGYYADVDGVFTDNMVDDTSAQRAANHNVPGDGKLDQNDFPSAIEVQIGRVDLADMPAFEDDEVELLRRYLDKVHAFKVGDYVPEERAIVFDNFQYLVYPLASSGWRSLSVLVGSANITEANPYGTPFHELVSGQSYLWTYASGGGQQLVTDGVLTYNGAANVGTTADYAAGDMGGVFNMSFGSYFGDWDNKNNFLRAPLASGDALTNVWAGIPNWWFHSMGLGATIGYATHASMNNTDGYTPSHSGWNATHYRVHMGLMGDPSLRMSMVAPPSDLSVTGDSAGVTFGWTASSEAVAGYRLYRIDPDTGYQSQVVSELITDNSYVATSIASEPGVTFMVRAVKRETTPSGSYLNLSLGATAVATGSPSEPTMPEEPPATGSGGGWGDGGATGAPADPNTGCSCALIVGSRSSSLAAFAGMLAALGALARLRLRPRPR